jgi:ATP/maltotriose-dependent transcriptional regulator MalT
VLAQQPPDIQDFLLRSAILGRFCADLCMAVLERTECQTILEP